MQKYILKNCRSFTVLSISFRLVFNKPPSTFVFSLLTLVRFKELSNNHLQIRGIKKTDEGPYTCEGRLMARGEIDFRIIKVIVNGG